jgi:hypothetical protein
MASVTLRSSYGAVAMWCAGAGLALAQLLPRASRLEHMPGLEEAHRFARGVNWHDVPS